MSSTWNLPDDLAMPARTARFPQPGEQVPRHWSKCFGCGDDQPAGMSMTFLAGEGLEVTARLEVSRKYEGGPGVIHGGVLSAAFDEAQGIACQSATAAVVTGHLEIDFARPIPLGSVLEIHAWVEGTVRRKVYTSAEARIIEGPGADPDVVVATSRALFLTITSEHFVKVQELTKDGGNGDESVGPLSSI